MNAFALTAILGGMTVLYMGITDLRVAMEAQRAEIIDVVRSENADLRERVVRAMEKEFLDLVLRGSARVIICPARVLDAL